jgi:hypothetical protein
MSLQLPNPVLAYVSACDTSPGGTSIPDEGTTLVSALQIVGYQHVVATLWQIIGFTATEIAKRLYDQVVTTRDRGPAAGSLPRRLTPAASPRWPSLVRGRQAGGRSRGAGGGSTGTAKAWQPTGTGSPATGRPLAAGPPAARGGPPPGFPGAAKTVSGIGRPFIRVREPVTLPCRQLICQLIRTPANSGARFQWRTRRTWR